MRRKLLFTGLFLSVCLATFGQKKRFKEVSIDDFHLEADWADSSFAALVLLDQGVIDFDLSAEEGFFYTLERRQRIRIENGLFSYKVYQAGNQIKVESRLKIGKSLFLPTRSEERRVGKECVST